MRLLFSVMCFSLFVSCGGTGTPDRPGDCSKNCNQIKPEEEKDLSNHPFYNTLHGTDCSIPEGTEVVHYPMFHRISKRIFGFSEQDKTTIEEVMNVHENVSYSSFNFIQMIKQHPTALVFSEAAWTQEMVDKVRFDDNKKTIEYLLGEDKDGKSGYAGSDASDEYTSGDEGGESDYVDDIGDGTSGVESQISSTVNEVLENIKIANSYEELSQDSIKVLSQLTGVEAAFFTSVIEEFYPATTFVSGTSVKEFKEVYLEMYGTDSLSVAEHLISFQQRILDLSDQFNQETDQVKKIELKEKMYQIYRSMLNLSKLSEVDFIFSYREQLLLESVENVISQPDNKGRLVVINYGAAHNFSDDFKDYNFYTLPYVCTLPQSLVSSNQFTLILIGIYTQTVMANLQDKEDVLSILRTEIINRLNHLSEENQELLEGIVKQLAKLKPLKISTSVKVDLDTIKMMLLELSSFNKGKGVFERLFNYYISLDDNNKQLLKEQYDQALQEIRKQKDSMLANEGLSKSEIEYLEPTQEPDEEEEKSAWESVKDWWNSW